MLGPAELRELDEALAEERTEGVRAEKTYPYLTPHFAMGMAVTRVAAASAGKVRFSPFGFKR
ncbi:hypothetical protein [Magnetospirillum sulfuroxidans]|uniref:Uncharacterized protein n=1 Tax=Magnetospirillum sulfuroxidans TaxID=611300 RepID=A0ABS5I7P2_9PROT|nr:hypothetical protein [Magnetospirillum sulfuroxidans]MBR9970425.1 hypothetical protein [Magnetospirillum sulfuroxidans]